MKVDLFLVIMLKSYSFVANRNFPQAFSIKSKDFTVILKSRIFAQKFKKNCCNIFSLGKIWGVPSQSIKVDKNIIFGAIRNLR